MNKLIPESELPKTRLELRWLRTGGYTVICEYNLVIQLWRLDKRGEVLGDNDEIVRRNPELRHSLGSTRTSQTGSFIRDGEIQTPFRDSSHIAWDSFVTGLPAFVVAEGLAMPLEPRELPND